METSKSLERAFLLPWLGSAAIVTVIRLLHAADLGYDLTHQIQAGQNLLAGKGLTTYTPTSENLADPLGLVTLTGFPSGYSLYAALVMALGAGPATVVKVMGATATMLGWWGWGKLAFFYMGEGWERQALWRRVGYFIAMTSPLLLTIPWGGTDILLWAAVPWVLHYVVRSPELQSQNLLRLDVAAGVLAGLCVLMRYASLFLVLYAGFLIVGQCRLRMAPLLRRATAFGFGLLPAFAIQTYVNYFLASRGVDQGLVTLDGGILAASTRTLDGLDHLTTATVSVLFWIPYQILDRFPETRGSLWALAVTVIVLALPAVVAVLPNGQKASSACHDLRIAGAGLFTIVPLFLLAAETASGVPYGVVPRYYWPIVPLALLIAYSLATTARRARLTRGLQLTGRAYLAAFVIVTSVLIVSLPVRGIWRVIGTTHLRGWPSFGVTYDDSPARRYVMGVLKAQPGVVFIANREQWFIADPEVDRSRIHRIESCGALKATHVTGPVRLLVLANEPPDDGGEFYWATTFGEPHRAECFDRLPPLKLLQRFPDEALQVLEGEVPDGVRVTLKDVSATSN
jgi:hypothetical protein